MQSSEGSVPLTRKEVFNLRGKRKLLVGLNEYQIEQVFRSFDLNPQQWGAIRWGAMLCGRGFDKIVVMHPGKPLSDKEECWYRELRCRLLTPESTLTLL